MAATRPAPAVSTQRALAIPCRALHKPCGVISQLSNAGLGLGSVGGGIVRGALSNAITQGIGVATGLQDRFDWTGVAVGSVVGGVAGGVGSLLTKAGVSGPSTSAGGIASRAASSDAEARNPNFAKGVQLASNGDNASLRGLLANGTATPQRNWFQRNITDPLGKAFDTYVAPPLGRVFNYVDRAVFKPVGQFIARTPGLAAASTALDDIVVTARSGSWLTQSVVPFITGSAQRAANGVNSAMSAYGQSQIYQANAQLAASQALVAGYRRLDNQYQVTTRLGGALQMLGGAAEGVVGSALVVGGGATSEIGVGIPVAAGGILLVGHASDTIATGARKVWTGRNSDTLTSQGLQALGASPRVANTIDAGIGIGGTLGGSVILNSGRLATTAPLATSGLSGGREIVAAERVAALEARGGAYVLRDFEGSVVRSGRTGDLVRREADHLRDPLLKDYRFRTIYKTDVYAEQRGLEQLLHDTYQPPLNKIRPISPTNPNRQTYIDAAQKYLGGN
jgi:hypothetical protein